MSQIRVTVGGATVDVEMTGGAIFYGQPIMGRYNPHDVVHAAVKALRAIDTDVSNEYAERFAAVWAEIASRK